MTRTGILSTVRKFPFRDSADRAVVASDGTNVLFTWTDAERGFCHVCDPSEMRRILAVRLGPGLTPIDSQPLVLAADAFSTDDEPHVQLIGSAARRERYEVYWMDDDQLIVQHVPRSGPFAGASRGTIPDTGDLAGVWSYDFHVSTSPSGLAIWPREGAGMMRFIRPDFFFASEVATTRFDTRELVAMPDGRAAWIGVDEELASPHHGAKRLMMDVRHSQAAVPDAPQATLTYDGREIRIDWDAPQQPVTGYRVEYRIGDGSWNELPRQYGADERSATWTSITRGKSYAFRVRAVSERGAGAYSKPVRVSVGSSRRRSVR